jgi:hypothetical protein
MSKMDALRAMREARYEQAAARATKPASAPKTTRRPAVAPSEAQAEAPAVTAEAANEPELCGHRNMGGRTCTREHGHAAKSHRYS